MGAGHIFNADNIPGAVWTAPVKIGFDGDPDQVILTGPGYTNTAESLGGGSVGLAPFRLHDTSCAPADGTTVWLRPSDDDLAEIQLRHYGPVTWTAGDPLTVSRRPVDSNDPFKPLPGSDFVFTPAPGDSNSIVVTAAPAAPGFERCWEYLLEPNPGVLKCAQVAGEPDVTDYDYTVIIKETCEADLDRDGEVGPADLAILLVAWGPCPDCNDCDADLDGDCVVGPVDLATLLANWGSCDGLCSGGEAQGGGSEAALEAAVMQLGFESVADCQAWLAQADDTEAFVCGQMLAARLSGQE